MADNARSSNPQAVDQLKSDLRSLRSDLETAAKTVNELGGAAASEAMHQAQVQMEAMQERLEGLMQDLQEYGDRQTEALREHIQAKPLQSMLIAVAAGFVLAQFLSRR
jgi:ElaB/YqjD/DUF883 family membrane-anchored ribosome-binding protein